MRILDILGRKSPNAIIRLFLENPAAAMQVRDIVKATKLAKLSVLNWTKELVKSEILSVSHVGRTSIFKLNAASQPVSRLRILHNVDCINQKIGKIEGDADVFIYGSFARGENTAKSDIDLLVIGKDRNVIRKLKAVDERIKISFYTPIEWSMTSRKDKAFFESIEKDKIRLR